MAEKMIIRCGQLFTSVDETVAEDMAVVIEGNRIIDILPWASAEHADAQALDLSDKFVMPGLIDCHAHVNMDGKSMLQQYLNENSIGDIALTSLQNAQANLLAGFTSIRDEGAAHFTDVAVKNAINDGKHLGPRMFVSGMPITATGGHCDSRGSHLAKGESLGIVCNGPEAVRAAVRFNLKHGADQIKIMATGGVMSFGDDPKYSEFSLEEMKMAVDTAQSHGRRTSAHAHGSDGIKIAVRAGITSIEHGMLMDDECIRLMAESGTYLIPTIIAAKTLSDDSLGLPQWMVDKARSVIDGHQDNLRKCREAGIPIGFGTDAGTNANFHCRQAKEMAYMKEFGFRTGEILLAATRVNATLMGWDKELGSIQADKLADIVAFDKSPFDDIDTVQEVSFVMKDGNVFKRDGKSAYILGG